MPDNISDFANLMKSTEESERIEDSLFVNLFPNDIKKYGFVDFNEFTINGGMQLQKLRNSKNNSNSKANY